MKGDEIVRPFDRHSNETESVRKHVTKYKRGGQNTSGKKVVKILVVLVAALSILNSSGASPIPGAAEKVATLVARATCSGASHSSDY